MLTNDMYLCSSIQEEDILKHTYAKCHLVYILVNLSINV